MIDNFDSFTFNLVHYLESLNAKVVVKRNNEITTEDIKRLNPSHIVLSPGPGKPKNAGICTEVVKTFQGLIPILGVCLGHQVIGEVFGAKVVKASKVKHGKTSTIYHDGKSLFKDIPQEFKATRYHSLTLSRQSLGERVMKTGWCFDEEDEVIMAIEVNELSLYGVQFHPESIASSFGDTLLSNFLSL